MRMPPAGDLAGWDLLSPVAPFSLCSSSEGRRLGTLGFVSFHPCWVTQQVPTSLRASVPHLSRLDLWNSSLCVLLSPAFCPAVWSGTRGWSPSLAHGPASSPPLPPPLTTRRRSPARGHTDVEWQSQARAQLLGPRARVPDPSSVLLAAAKARWAGALPSPGSPGCHRSSGPRRGCVGRRERALPGREAPGLKSRPCLWGVGALGCWHLRVPDRVF